MDRRPRPGHLRLLASVEIGEPREVPPVGDPSDIEMGAGPGTIGILLGGGQALVRAGYRALLEVDERLKVMGEATSGNHAVVLAGRMQPDVVLLDLGLPGLEHPDGVARILSHPFLIDAAVMLVIPAMSDERVVEALRAGAVGVLASDARPDELRIAVRMLAAGQAVLPVAMFDRLIDELPARGAEPEPATQRLRGLTDREREVVALVSKGLTDEQIARHLVISPATAKTHVCRAMGKARVGHRAELVVLAYETGLVRPPTPASPAPLRLLNID